MPAKKDAPRTATHKPPRINPSGKRQGRPRRADAAGVMSVRVPVAVIEALDRYAAHESTATPWRPITRNDVHRRLLLEGLERAGFLTPSPKPIDVDKGGK